MLVAGGDAGPSGSDAGASTSAAAAAAASSAPASSNFDAAAAYAAAGGQGSDSAAVAGASGSASAGHDHGPVLSERQLMEVFKQTSIFNVRSALANNELLTGGYGGAFGFADAEGDPLGWGASPAGSDDEGEAWAQLSGFWCAFSRLVCRVTACLFPWYCGAAVNT